MSIEIIAGSISLAAFIWLFFFTFMRSREIDRLESQLATVTGQLAAEQHKVAMMHAARSEASRKGARTKRDKAMRIQLGDFEINGNTTEHPRPAPDAAKGST